MTFRPWVINHTLHHAERNFVELDPDTQHPLLAFTAEAARERRGVLRWLVRYQAYAYPFMALFTTAFRLDAWRRVSRRGPASGVDDDGETDERRGRPATLPDS